VHGAEGWRAVLEPVITRYGGIVTDLRIIVRPTFV